MGTKIGGFGIQPSPIQLDDIGQAERAKKAGAVGADPALIVDHAAGADPKAGAGPLDLEDLLPAPDYDAAKRVFAGAPEQAGASAPAQGQPTSASTFTAKLDSPGSTDENAALAATMEAVFLAMQSDQTMAKAEDSMRRFNVQQYASKMDTAADDLRTAASDTWNAAIIEGTTGIVAGACSMAGAGIGAFGSSSSTAVQALGDATVEGSTNAGLLTSSGQVIGSSGKFGGAHWTKEASDRQADKTEDQTAGSIFQSAAQSNTQHRDTFRKAVDQVIQSATAVVNAVEASKQAVASARA